MHQSTFRMFFTLAAAAAFNSVCAAEVPHFIDPQDLKNPVFECLHPEDANQKYTPEEQRLVDQLWSETLTYLQAYAKAVTTDTTGACKNSDTAIYETVDGFKSLCITDRREIKDAVKHIYQILAAPDRAKACFAPRASDRSMMMPGGELLRRSPVAQWIKRQTLEDFYSHDVPNPEVRKLGISFAKNFDQMVLGDALKTPANFGTDVTANSLPNLWASAGWVPMYAADSERNKRNFPNVRGGYAYAEVMGHWGLLRIKSINGSPVGAEIGMTVQKVGTLYPYHNHAISEMYYTLREPATTNQFRSFAVRADNPHVRTIYENAKERKVEFDAGMPNEPAMWASTAWNQAPLVYFYENTIHAFDMKDTGEEKPAERAMVAVWARGNAADLRNDYGNTRLCENGDAPNTPALRGHPVRCELTQQKW